MPVTKWLTSVKRALRDSVDASLWKPTHAELLWSQVAHRNRNQAYSDLDYLLAAAAWLERAQDAMTDGGVCGRYRLSSGWTSSYPETTGYIIPTFLALAQRLEQPQFRDRAGRCVEFLLGLQLESGAFPGGEIRENRTQASFFNSGQILCGLTAWHHATGDERALTAACRAAEWIASIQDPEGLFRQFTYENVVTTYSSHSTCWVAELGRALGNDTFLKCAERHLDWVLRQQDPQTGWFDLCGFTPDDHQSRRGVTHTIAYTIWGVLATSVAVNRQDGIDAARKAAAGVARRTELAGRLPGVLDHQWKPAANYACLTGCAQMALIWFRLFELTGDITWVNPALKAIDQVERAISMTSTNPGIRGGIPGSDPIWGGYIRLAIPNWAAKFFIDALLAKDAVLEQLSRRPLPAPSPAPVELPREVPAPAAAAPTRPLNVVMLAGPSPEKMIGLLERWSGWGFRPAAVVQECRSEPTLAHRIQAKIESDGLQGLLRRAVLRDGPDEQTETNGTTKSSETSDLVRYCASRQIPFVKVESLNAPAGLDVVRRFAPDLAVHAGAGILRAPLLAIPRLGVINAHMGVLPEYRGMNVAEWGRLLGGPVGCTVHLIDPGIDTGDILCLRPVDVQDCRSIAELRRAVDEAQVQLLGDVVRSILATGELPPRWPQQTNAGRQYFVMHRDLKKLLERKLSTGASSRSIR